MCTRYCMELSPELRPYIEAARRSPLNEKMTVKLGRKMITEGEIKPGDIAPVIATSRKGTPASYPMTFGFPSATGSLILNARSETASQKPMFREAWSRRRCIVPASWYYEWQHFILPDGRKKAGDKYMFQPADSNVTWMCGLYRIDDGIPCFVILTRSASGDPAKIHDRMPLILPAGAVRQWINPASEPEALMGMLLSDMVYEKAE